MFKLDLKLLCCSQNSFSHLPPFLPLVIIQLYKYFMEDSSKLSSQDFFQLSSNSDLREVEMLVN